MPHLLKWATTLLCGESWVSISMVYLVTATPLSKHLKENLGESPKVSQFKRTLSALLERWLAPADVSRAHKVASIALFLDLRHKHLRFTASLMNLNLLYRQRCVLSSWAAPRKWKRWFAAMKWCCLCFCHCSPVWWWFKVETNYWTKRVLPGQVPTPLHWSNRMLENQLKQIFPPRKTSRCIFAHRLIF